MKKLLIFLGIMLISVVVYAGIIYDNTTDDISSSSGSMTIDGGGIATSSSTNVFTNKTIDAAATGNVITNVGISELEAFGAKGDVIGFADGTAATGTVEVTAGTNSAGVNKVSGITVNSVEIMAGAEDWVTSHTATATAIKDSINAKHSVPEYTASSSGATVTITAVKFGTTVNTFVVAATVAGDVSTTDVNMASGANGAAKLIVFPGGWEFIVSQTASASTSVDFTAGIDSTYDVYMVTMANVLPTTDGTDLRLLISDDGGLTYEEDATDYEQANMYADSATAALEAGASAGISRITLTSKTSVGNGTGEGLDGILYFSEPDVTSNKKFWWHLIFLNSEATPELAMVAGVAMHNGSTLAINAIRFLMSSDTIASGTFALYGLKTS